MRKVPVGHWVEITAGRFKGHRGRLIRIFEKSPRSASARLLSVADRTYAEVEGVTRVKHVRGNPQTQEKGKIDRIPCPIHISNIAAVNPSSSKADRIGFRIEEDGKKVRFYKSTGEQVTLERSQ